jgi:hypothetical protein
MGRSPADLTRDLRSTGDGRAAELFRERLRSSLREALADVVAQPPTAEQAELAQRIERALQRASGERGVEGKRHG